MAGLESRPVALKPYPKGRPVDAGARIEVETLIAGLADQGSQATFFGVASLAWAISGTAGNYIGSWLILESTPTVTWLCFGGVALLGFLLAAAFARLRPAPQSASSFRSPT
mgnify:CR=1 FL=1